MFRQKSDGNPGGWVEVIRKLTDILNLKKIVCFLNLFNKEMSYI